MSSDQKTKLETIIKQAQARLSAIEARESAVRRKLETRGMIVFSGFAVKVSPALLDQAIAALDGKPLDKRQTLDLEALKAFKGRAKKEG